MGKRELFIVVAFVIAGAVTYQLTAPPAKPGEGFSWAKLWSHARSTVQSTNASATWTSHVTVSAAASVREIRIKGVNGAVRIIGEARADVVAEFVVHSTGPDEATALAFAKNSHLKIDNLEDAIVLSTAYPLGGRQVGALTLRVPQRLSAKVEGGNGMTASDLDSLQLTGTAGPGTLLRIAGQIGGDSRVSGALRIADAGSIDLTLTNGQTTITGTRGALRLDARTGQVIMSHNVGPIEIESRQAELEVEANTGTIRVGGQGGRLRIIDPLNEIRVDMRRTSIHADVHRAVPMSLSTTEAPLDFSLARAAGGSGARAALTFDAIAADGEINASDWQLVPTKGDRESRLEHVFGTGPRVSLRTTRGDITFRVLKEIEIAKRQ
jgi:hypothetical protein